MNRFILKLLCVASCILVLGCKKEEPNPELLDPIYKDLQSEADGFKKVYDEGVETLKSLKKDLAKAEPNTIEMKDIIRDIKKAEAAIVHNEQLARYFRIKAERRKFEGRIAYKLAFQRGEEWPNPKEYSDYLVNKRVMVVNRNWNARVPKLQDRLLASQKPKKSNKKGE